MYPGKVMHIIGGSKTYNLMNKCDNYLWDSNYSCCCYGNRVIHNTCNMYIHDLPDMLALRLAAYISGKSFVPVLQLLHVYKLHDTMIVKGLATEGLLTR